MIEGGLAGKRVLITGGGTGVRADLARGFAEAGASVVICCRREAPLRAVAQQPGAPVTGLDPLLAELTPRELEVLRAVAEGLSNA